MVKTVPLEISDGDVKKEEKSRAARKFLKISCGF